MADIFTEGGRTLSSLAYRVARAARLLLAAAVIAGAGALVDASSPRFFQVATQADFLKGDVDNLSIDNRGQLVLGPATELMYETTAPFLWSLLPGPNNSFFVGTGNEGRVFRIDGPNNGTSFFDAGELEAHALAPAPDGGLYVASSPDGRIYKVDRSGNARTFFEPGEKYIWALAADARGVLYAATGEKGVVYRITPDGAGSRFYQAKATHVTALALDGKGNLLVGTESPGRVIRVDASGKGFVLLDSPFKEVKALKFDSSGALYVAALNGSATPPAPPRVVTQGDPPANTSSPPGGPVATVTAEVTSVAIVDVSAAGASGSGSTREDRRSPRGGVFRIAADGLWDQVWESRDDSPYDIAFDSSGRLIIATGNRGKIFRLEGSPPQPTLLARAAAQQVTALHTDAAGRLYFATANPGKLYRLGSNHAAQGTFESEVRDAGMVARWGTVSWRGSVPDGAQIAVSTRSGNTDTPDDTWSAWSAPQARGDATQVLSPNARYLQWRAVLTGKGAPPVLTSVTIAYLQRNLRPQVRSITVHPPGIVFQKPFSTGDPDLAGFEDQTTPDRRLTSAAMNTQPGGNSPSLGRRTYQKGLQTLVWRADDENEDDLTYEVQYRREGETAWKTLRRDLTEPIFVWDTTTVPNGTYFVRVLASDGPSNAADLALAGEMDSAAFEIDNIPPAVTVKSARTIDGRTVVAVQVTDDHSPVQRVEYSPDGLQWTPAFPQDAIADSRSEQYEITLPGALGPRGLSIRATDAMNNVGAAQVDGSRPR